MIRDRAAANSASVGRLGHVTDCQPRLRLEPEPAVRVVAGCVDQAPAGVEHRGGDHRLEWRQVRVRVGEQVVGRLLSGA